MNLFSIFLILPFSEFLIEYLLQRISAHPKCISVFNMRLCLFALSRPPQGVIEEEGSDSSEILRIRLMRDCYPLSFSSSIICKKI
ncbi:MAG: hypothetical protein AM326_03250 [Candidatus Thorarchaeota archaeon SMTZ-45]|nr:MAG: hypothetical protein AM326_03250 [Candidatus Thorarchaeota archaeon SMTZ-45]